MATKKTFTKRLNKIVQFPGALLCLILYTLMALVGVNNRIGDARVKSFFMAAIPWVSGAIWLGVIVWLFSIVYANTGAGGSYFGALFHGTTSR